MSNTRTLTAANCQIALSVDTIFPVPILMSGFATDNIFRFSDVTQVQTLMGVDGRLSAGWSAVSVPWLISFMGDSLSVDVFEAVIARQKAQQTAYAFTGLIDAPSLNKSASMRRGFLGPVSTFNSADKMMSGRTFSLVWESVDVLPLSS